MKVYAIKITKTQKFVPSMDYSNQGPMMFSTHEKASRYLITNIGCMRAKVITFEEVKK